MDKIIKELEEFYNYWFTIEDDVSHWLYCKDYYKEYINKKYYSLFMYLCRLSLDDILNIFYYSAKIDTLITIIIMLDNLSNILYEYIQVNMHQHHKVINLCNILINDETIKYLKNEELVFILLVYRKSKNAKHNYFVNKIIDSFRDDKERYNYLQTKNIELSNYITLIEKNFM